MKDCHYCSMCGGKMYAARSIERGYCLACHDDAYAFMGAVEDKFVFDQDLEVEPGDER